MDDAATTLHPCWEAYRLADRYVKLVQCMAGPLSYSLKYTDVLSWVLMICRRDLVVYLNSFSGEATIEFPSTLQMARGGVCMNAMIE